MGQLDPRRHSVWPGARRAGLAEAEPGAGARLAAPLRGAALSLPTETTSRTVRRSTALRQSDSDSRLPQLGFERLVAGSGARVVRSQDRHRLTMMLDLIGRSVPCPRQMDSRRLTCRTSAGGHVSHISRLITSGLAACLDSQRWRQGSDVTRRWATRSTSVTAGETTVSSHPATWADTSNVLCDTRGTLP